MENRFEDLGETILDHKTNLEWEKEYRLMSWAEGMKYAANLFLNNQNDWRMPILEELESLRDLEKFWPASDFPNMPSSWFWSSSSYAGSSSAAWYVGFYGGHVSYDAKGYTYYVRCVRNKYPRIPR